MKKQWKRGLAAALSFVLAWNQTGIRQAVWAKTDSEPDLLVEEVEDLSDSVLYQTVPYGTPYEDLEFPDVLTVLVQESDEDSEDEDEAEAASSSDAREATASSSDAEETATSSDADEEDGGWQEAEVSWVLNENQSIAPSYSGEVPGIYVFDVEFDRSDYGAGSALLPSITVEVEPDEASQTAAVKTAQDLPDALADGEIIEADGIEENLDMNGMDLPDPDELLQGYFDQQLGGGYGIEPAADYGLDKLTGRNRIIYEILKAQIEKVAAGEETSTEFQVTMEDLGLQVEYTAQELADASGVEVEAIMEDGALTDAAKSALHTLSYIDRSDASQILSALLVDCPYELYWYDKTEGMSWSVPGYYYSKNWVQLTGSYTFKFPVSADYSLDGEKGTYVTNDRPARVATAVGTIEDIIYTCADESDYAKIQDYSSIICGSVDYNYAAAKADSSVYGDPWQLIYVFDGDDDTKVVCEGFAKAFQYLCDLTEWNNSSVICYTVTGDLTGGGHMWNILSVNNQNFLVDITEVNSGWGTLLLGGLSGDWDGTYTYVEDSQNFLTYAYDDDTKELYSEAELKLADHSATEEDFDDEVVKLNDVISNWISVMLDQVEEDEEYYFTLMIMANDKASCIKLGAEDDDTDEYRFSERVKVGESMEDVTADLLSDVLRNMEFDGNDIGSTFTFYISQIIPSDAVNYDGITYRDAEDQDKIEGGFEKDNIEYDNVIYGLKVAVSENGDGTLALTGSVTRYQGVLDQIDERFGTDGKMDFCWNVEGKEDVKYTRGFSFENGYYEPIASVTDSDGNVTEYTALGGKNGALAAAGAGDTVTLYCNISVDYDETITIEKAIILDLGGYAISSLGSAEGSEPVLTVSDVDGTVEIRNGKIGHSSRISVSGSDTVLKLADSGLTVTGGILLNDGSKAEITGGNIGFVTANDGQTGFISAVMDADGLEMESRPYFADKPDEAYLADGFAAVAGGSGEYTNTVAIDFSKAELTVDPESYIYDGTEKRPAVTVELNGVTIPDTYYEVTYENNTDRSTEDEPAVVVVKAAHEDYTGEASADFLIIMKEETPNAEIDYENETLSGLDANCLYEINGTEEYTADEKGEIGIESGWFGTELSIVKPAREDGGIWEDSAEQVLDIPARPELDSGAFAVTDESVDDEADGSIVPVDTEKEYQYQKDGSWETLPQAGLSGLADGTYQVRQAAVKGENFTSGALTLTVGKGAKREYNVTVTAPEFAEVSYGYDQPEAKAVTIAAAAGNNVAVKIIGVSVNSGDFELAGAGTIELAAGESDSGTYQVQPVTGLNAGTHTAVLTVTWQDMGAAGTEKTSKAEISLTVLKAVPAVGTVWVSAPEVIYPSTACSDILLARTDTSVPGTLSLESGQKLTAGTKEYSWVFIPSDSDNYESVSGTVEITVTADALAALNAAGTPEKTAYVYGEDFQTDGITVTAVYASGREVDVTDAVTFGKLSVGDTEITLSYAEDGVTKTCTVAGITVDRAPRSITLEDGTVTTTTVDLTAVKPDQGENDGTVKYGYAETNDSSKVTNWQTGTSFEGLNWNTTYYFFAQVTGGANYEDAISSGQAIRTADRTTVEITIEAENSIYDGQPKQGYSGTVSAGSYTGELEYTYYEGEDRLTGAPTAAGTYRLVIAVPSDNSDYTGKKGIGFTIGKAPLEVTAGSKEITYGDSAPETYEVTYSGFVNGEGTKVLDGALTFHCDYAQGSPAGTYAVEPGGFTAANYEIIFAAGTLTVNRKELDKAAVAAIADQVYSGEPQKPALTVTDGTVRLEEGVDYIAAYSNHTDAGEAVVTLTGINNYIGTVETTFLIGKAPAPELTWPAASEITYGQALSGSELTGGSTGYGSFAWKEPETVFGAGEHSAEVVFTPDEDTLKNYEEITSTVQEVTVSVAKARLAVKADALSKTYGQEDPELTYTVSGLVGSDTEGSVLSGALERESGENVKDGGYAIGKGTLETVDGNYELSYTGAVLMITQATPAVEAVSVVSPAVIYPSTSLDDMVLEAETSVPGTLKLADGQTLVAGTQEYNWIFTPEDEGNMETVTGSVSVTVKTDTIVSLTVTGTPDRTEYEDGGSFETAGLTVTAEYESGLKKDVTSQVTSDALSAGQTSVTLTYLETGTGEAGTCTVNGITVTRKTKKSSSTRHSGSGGSGGGSTPSSGAGTTAKHSDGSWNSSYVPSLSDAGGHFEGAGEDWRYVKANGNLAENEWISSGGDWYYFGSDGRMKFGWFLDPQSGLWYMLNPVHDGHFGAAVRGWYQDPQDLCWYFLNPVSAEMLVGWQYINHNWYYLNPLHDEAWQGDNENGWLYKPSNGGRSFGSMYRDEETPDGHAVDENGARTR